MRKSILAGAVLGAALVFGSAGGAFAGEIGGNGEDTAGPEHARSLCVFSGLEDFDNLAPVDPGVTQNWGQIPHEFRQELSTRGASSVSTPFGEEGCNAHLYPNK